MDVKWILNFEYITFLKGYDAGFPKNFKFSINSCFEKNFSGGSLCMRRAAGIWAVDLFSTTYFDEIIIFELSMDQTFRIRCTLMNPEQISILVTHLLKINSYTPSYSNKHNVSLQYIVQYPKLLSKIWSIFTNWF